MLVRMDYEFDSKIKIAKIKIAPYFSRNSERFSKHGYSKQNKTFLYKNIGTVIKATRFSMNYWKLDNGFLVHIEDAKMVSK